MIKKRLIFLGLLIFVLVNLAPNNVEANRRGGRRGGIISSDVPAWQYTRAITINNTSGTITDCQVQVLLTTAVLGNPYNNFATTGADVRIKSADKVTPLNFWIESFNADGTSSIWVKIPNLITGTTTIYLDYGNSSAVSASSGTNTFDFFDDFNNDLSKWIRNTAYSTANSIFIENQKLKITGNAVSWPVGLYTSATFNPRTSIIDVKMIANAANNGGMFGWRVNDNNWYRVFIGVPTRANDFSMLSFVDGVVYSNIALADNFRLADIWYTISFRNAPINTTLYLYDVTTPGSSQFVGSTDNSNNTFTTAGIGIGDWTDGILYLDDVRVRKHMASEPIITIGAQETL